MGMYVPVKKPALVSMTARERAINSNARNSDTKAFLSVSHLNYPDICKKRATEEHLVYIL